MRKSLVLFDFDHTITTVDTFIGFLRFTKGKWAVYWMIALYSPWILAFQAGLFSAESLKRRMFNLFFSGSSEKKLREYGHSFIQHLEKEGIIKPEFISLINEHHAKGSDMAVVSASLDVWIDAFCMKYKMTSICTCLDFKNGIYSGNFLTQNCKGEEKKKRILQELPLSSYQHIIAYGNNNDKPMMEIATEEHYV